LTSGETPFRYDVSPTERRERRETTPIGAEGAQMSADNQRASIYSRRQFARVALAALPLSFLTQQSPRKRIDSTIKGVRIGVQSFSFRSLSGLNEIISAMTQIGVGSVEMMSDHAEAGAGAPMGAGGMSQWRRSISMDSFRGVRQKFQDAGIEVAFLCYNFPRETSDEELEYAFRMAQALGVTAITTSTHVSMAKRIAPFADKHAMTVGFHNHHHSNANDPDDIVTPASFDACTSASKYHGINLDIGHFTAANFDAVAFIEKNHPRITNIHLKDRKKNQGPIVRWGTGDAPIKAVLQLMSTKQYSFPANIEYEYPGGDPVSEVRNCYQFCRDALIS
jgi:sugar phosphate isomerase/epimerase